MMKTKIIHYIFVNFIDSLEDKLSK